MTLAKRFIDIVDNEGRESGMKESLPDSRALSEPDNAPLDD